MDALLSLLLYFVVFLVIAQILHDLRRRLIVRRMNIGGPLPSFWNPFGLEYLLWKTARTSRSIGEALMKVSQEFFSLLKHHELVNGWIIHKPLVIVTKPETAELFLSSTTNIDKTLFYTFLGEWIGDGLLVSSGTKWHSRRKMLTPAFHFRILDDFLPIMNEQALIFSNKLSDTRGEFDLTKIVSNCTLDIICETAMGVHLNAQNCPNSNYVQAVHRATAAVVQRSVSPWLWPRPTFYLSSLGRQFRKDLEILQAFSMQVIDERLAEMRSLSAESKQHVDGVAGRKLLKPFLNLLLERHITEGDLSLEDIKEEVHTFMFEGHDTTAVGISWILYLLAENSHVMKRVQTELDEIFDGDVSRYATIDDLSKMKYLECCIKESQRLFPSVPVISRELREDVRYKASVVPAGTTVQIPIFQLHRDEKTFPNPLAFEPERFLPENSASRHPYAYIPFSAGSRNCIGQKFAMMEEKVVISWVLRKLTVKTSVCREDLRVVWELVTRSANGIPIQVERRP